MTEPVADPALTTPLPPPRAPRTPRGYLHWLGGQVGDAGVAPLMILLAVSGLERFGFEAIGLLTPNIRDSFHISNGTAVATVSLAAILPALLSPWAGYLSDRLNRVRFAQVGTACVAIVSVGLGIVPWYWAFAVLAVAQGLGLLINTPTHSSLITDYYPPEALGTTFTFYLFGGAAAALLASPIAGGLGQVVGWRATFLLLAIPAGIGVVLMGRLHEPSRGASIGLSVEHEERASFAEGFRRVKAVRSLRRTWWAAAFFGGGAVAFRPLSNIFFKDVYHYGAAARGGVAAIFGVGGLVGIIVGGRVVQTRLRRGQPELLPVINGVAVVVFGAGVLLMGLMPFSLGSAAMLFFVGAGASAFLPAYNAMIGLVTAPRLRGQAFSYSLLWVALGAVVNGAVIGGISDHHQRAAAYVLGALIMMAGLVEVTARQFVQRDVAEARQVQTAADVDALLAVRGLEAAYAGNVQVLFGVDLDVHEGEIVALLGTNGAGKSTFLRAVSGLIDPIGGAVFYAGRDITHSDSVTKAQLGIALVPGDRGVFPGLSVAENLRVAAWMFRKDSAEMEAATDRVLDFFPVLRERLDTAAGSLSGGEQQMVVLAQALMGKPRLLLIDELSLGLAPVVVEQLLETVRRLAKAGTTVVLVEQSVNMALMLAERAVFMEKGEIRFAGKTAELLERPDVLRAVFLEGAQQAMGVSTGNGHRPAAGARRRPSRAAAGNGSSARHAVLEVHEVSKHFGGVMASDAVSLTLHDGEILGLMGPNGAGKTTLFDLISGFFPVDSGRIFLHGFEITGLAPDARGRLGLGRSFQDSKLFPAMTISDCVKVALERHIAVRDPIAAALQLPAAVDSELEVARRADELVEMLGLDAYRNKFVAEVSTGTRRMVDLACILAHEPSVILFDEPSSGIAQRETEALGPVLRRVREMTGSSLLVIEHDMPLLTGLADEIVALDLGRVVMQGKPAEVVSDPRVVTAYLGTEAGVVARSGQLAPARRSRPKKSTQRVRNGPPPARRTARKHATTKEGDE